MDLSEPSSEKTTISYLLNPPEVPPTRTNSITFLLNEDGDDGDDDVQILPSPKSSLSFLINPADENDANHMPIVVTEEEDEVVTEEEDDVVTEEEDEIVISSPKKYSLSFIGNPLNQASMEKEPLITSPSPIPEDWDKKYWNAIKRILIQHGISIKHTKRTLLKQKNLGISRCINNNINQHIIEALHKENMSSEQIALIVTVKEDAVKNYLSQVPFKKHLSSFNISRSRQTANNGPNIIPSQSFEKPTLPNDILRQFLYGDTKTGYDPTIQHTYPSKKRKRSEEDKLTFQNTNSWPEDMLIVPPRKIFQNTNAWPEDMLIVPPRKKIRRNHLHLTPPMIKAQRDSILPHRWRIIERVLIKHGLDKWVAENLKFNGTKPWGTKKGSRTKRLPAMNELIDTCGMSYKEVGAALGLSELTIKEYRKGN